MTMNTKSSPASVDRSGCSSSFLWSTVKVVVLQKSTKLIYPFEVWVDLPRAWPRGLKKPERVVIR